MIQFQLYRVIQRHLRCINLLSKIKILTLSKLNRQGYQVTCIVAKESSNSFFLTLSQ